MMKLNSSKSARSRPVSTSSSQRSTPSSNKHKIQLDSTQADRAKNDTPVKNGARRGVVLFVVIPLFLAGFLLTAMMISESPRAQQDSFQTAAAFEEVAVRSASSVQLSRCQGTEYVEGTWEFDASKTKPSFPCCDVQIPRDLKRCGSLANSRLEYHGNPKWPAQIYGHESDCEQWGFVDRYTWNPSKCFLPAWNAQRFCEILGNKTVLIVGDSQARQTATTLINNIMFVDRNHKTNQTCHGQIYYRAGDTLVGRKYSSMNRGWNWKESVRIVRPDLVVLSVGGHVGSLDSFLEVLHEVNKDLQEEILPEFPDLRLIWRTVVPAGCQKEMLKQHPKEIRGYWDRYVSDGKPNFNYDLHHQWEQEAKKFWSQNERFQIMDMDPLAFRTDAHPSSNKTVPSPPGTKWDCVHMCVPGPLDLFSRLLMNAVRDLKAENKW
eukprot:TRINITY_DN2585_c0_g1_i1.p1 TRINITY_DN2585_c0_g1~~TRINITY_DN2585_c0_g1_i1.p1  ORF type:complete len:435 (+),score=90.22 TRINITY_DN2585_c0_g1_i1:176-1480(+)